MNPICAGHVEGFRKTCVCIWIEHAPIFVVSLAAAAFRLSRLNPLLLGRPLDQCARIDACVLAQADDDSGPELAPPSPSLTVPGCAPRPGRLSRVVACSRSALYTSESVRTRAADPESELAF